MARNERGGYSFLDHIRINEGSDRCKAVFNGICETDRGRAAGLLNDPRLTFGCFFILSPQIAQFQLERHMSPRNMAALKIAGPTGRPEGGEPSARNEAARAALKWMLETGHADDGLSDEYEEILEVAASVLINAYRDLSALPVVIDMIFERSRRGHNIHSLVWAAFQSRSPHTLKLIAQRIRSSDERDARLALSLLGIEAPEDGAAGDNQKRYESYIRWLGENDPFLYFTGESLQYASRPAFYSVDLERKYIHRGTPRYDRQPVSPADQREREALTAFNTLGSGEKALLSEYSHKLHAEDPSKWKTWVRLPIEEQVKSAKLGRGEFNDYGIGSYV
jgi:hypothetical protein